MSRVRVLLVGITVVAVVTAVVLVVLNRRADEPASTAAHPSGSQSLLAVDDHGAIVRDGASHELRGYDADNVLRWKAPDTGGLAICATRCPDAILTGSLDAMNSPLIQTTTRQEGPQEVSLPSDHQVWAPARLGGATLVIRSDRQGRTRLTTLTRMGAPRPIPLESPRFTWVAGTSGSAVLFTGEGSRAWVRIVTVADGKPVVGPRLSVADDGGACTAADGRALVALKDGVTAINPAGKAMAATFDLRPDELGACAVTPWGFVVSSLTMLGDGTRLSRVRFFNNSGRQTSSMEVNEEAIPLAAPTKPLVLLSSDTSTSVRDSSGAQVQRFDNTSSAQFTPTGRLVLLTHQGHLRWTDL